MCIEHTAKRKIQGEKRIERTEITITNLRISNDENDANENEYIVRSDRHFHTTRDTKNEIERERLEYEQRSKVEYE